MQWLLDWIVPARALRRIGKTDNSAYYLPTLTALMEAGHSVEDITMGMVILAMNEESEW